MKTIKALARQERRGKSVVMWNLRASSGKINPNPTGQRRHDVQRQLECPLHGVNASILGKYR